MELCAYWELSNTLFFKIQIDGCSHIHCRCGSDWCYGCAKILDECDCEGEEEEEDDAYEGYPFPPELPRAREPLRPRTPIFRELQENIIEDTMVAPSGRAWDEDGHR